MAIISCNIDYQHWKIDKFDVIIDTIDNIDITAIEIINLTKLSVRNLYY